MFQVPMAALCDHDEPPILFELPERLWLALQESQPSSIVIPATPLWIVPGSTRFGVLTLVPPDTNGEMIKVVVPVGELVSRASQAVVSAPGAPGV